MTPFITRPELAKLRRRVLQQGDYFKPEIACFTEEQGAFVVKDCACMQPLIRTLFGRRNHRREIAIYRRLDGVKGVPEFQGIIDRDAFALAYVEGATLGRDLPLERIERAMEDLERVLAQIHSRGVVHLDLKQKRNILVRPDNTVAVLDFQSAMAFKPGFPGAWLLALLKRRDLAGLIKFKARYIPYILNSKEIKLSERERFLSRLWPFKHLVRGLRKLFKPGR